MNFLRKFGIVFLIAGTVFFAACGNNAGGSNNGSNGGQTGGQVNVPQKYKDPVTAKTAAQIIEMMGAGWNLGNTLDAAEAGESGDTSRPGSGTLKGLETETSWGMPETTKVMIDAVAAAGFSHVRVPVSWHNHIQSDGKIDPKWIARVKEIVDWIIEDGMFCVINIHHDTWTGNGTFWGYSVDGTHESESITYVENIWDQVAKYFKDYDQRLVFETLNEPRNRKEHEWSYTSSCSKCKTAATTINTLNEKALAKIRAAGDKNNERLVIVTPYVASPDAASNSDFKIPTTDTVNNLLALSVHAYSPYSFAMQSPGETSFTSVHKTALDGIFNNLKTNFVDKGIPVFIGEYGATNKNNKQERINWAKYYVAGASAKKMAYCLWDNNNYNVSGTDYNEHFGYFNRNTLTWYDEDFIKAVTGSTDLSGSNTDDGETGGGNTDDGETGGGNTDPTPGTKTALGLTGISTDATAIYSFSNKSDTGATIEVTNAADGWKTFSVGFTSGKEKISMKIKNENTTKAANVRFDLLDGWTNQTPVMKTAKKDNSDFTVTSQEASGSDPAKKYVQFNIPAGQTVSLELTMESTAAVLVCYFDSSQASGGTAGGKITISEAYMY